jgi:long-chain acyl-CoA synthetase
MSESYPEWPNLATLMFARAADWPARTMLRWCHQGSWRSMRWGTFGRQAARVARGLRAEGLRAGDRVLIVSENRPEVPIVETALMAIRAVPVPTYVTNTVADHVHILRDSGARGAIVSTPALAQKLRAAVAQTGGLLFFAVIDPDPEAATSYDMLAGDTALSDAEYDETVAAAATIPPEALACLIYTSGTAGAPRGVMLPHRAIMANCRGAFELMRPLRLRDETYLSFLPVSHSYEHTAGQFFLPSIGTEIVYSRGLEHLAADMLTVRPTIMTVVPRVLELIRARILAQVARGPVLRRRLFERAMQLGARRLEGERLSLRERLEDGVLERLVRRRIRGRFGGRLRAAMSGGARLEPEVGRFFETLGLKVMQGYGLTEAGPVISANPPDATRIDTVGRVLPGVEVRIADDGEILVRGALVMHGYWGQPEATAEALRDGWLHTGDIGTLDADGYLRITDRKKDIIVLSGGETISPARIEGLLMAETEIAQAVVTGDGHASLSALVVRAEGSNDAAVAAAVARVNERLAVPERVRRHLLVPPFTIENKLLTPTQKIRRTQVVRAHSAELARLRG